MAGTRPATGNAPAWRVESPFDQTIGIHPSIAEKLVTMRERFSCPQNAAAE
jgi:hypothetical protein